MAKGTKDFRLGVFAQFIPQKPEQFLGDHRRLFSRPDMVYFVGHT
jgi:hypothetical protein